MPKVTLNKLIESFSGKVGDFILYEADGQMLSRAVPSVHPERTGSQQTNSNRFQAAGLYAKKALADPVVKAAYKTACVGHQDARNLAIRDALTPPVVEALSLEGYSGRVGQTIRIQATDDFQVATVLVMICDPQGNILDQGAAELDPSVGDWRYAAKSEVATGQTVSVTVTAKDRPGNVATLQRWHRLG